MFLAFSKTVLFLSFALLSYAAGATSYSCTTTASPTSWTPTYNDGATQNSGTVTISVLCQRSGGGAGTNSWDIQMAIDHGLAPSGTQNRAASAANPSRYVNYDRYTTTGCSVLDTTPITIGTWNNPNNAGVTFTFTFVLCMPAGQSPYPAAAADFADTITFTPSVVNLAGGGGGVTSVTGTTISITGGTVAPYCQITIGPGNIDFTTYVAGNPTTYAGTSFGLRCNNFLTAFTVEHTGTVSGLYGGLLSNNLNYTANISGTTSGSGAGSNPLSTPPAATGVAQTYYINGILPQQYGTCSGSCAGSEARTLTITY